MSTKPPFSAARLAVLIDQYDASYTFLHDRLQGLSDEEYFWEPVRNCWSVRHRSEAKVAGARGKGEWVMEVLYPEPAPAPMTTIAWRLCHIVSGQRMRCDYTFGAKSLDWDDIEFPGNAGDALRFLEDSHSAWRSGLAGLRDADLDIVGLSSYSEGMDPDLPFGAIFWWTNRELIHHGGEIGVLRDLWRLR